MALMTVDSEGTGDSRSKSRWSAGRKMDVVLRLLPGREARRTLPGAGRRSFHRLEAAWRDEFLDGAQGGPEGKAPQLSR